MKVQGQNKKEERKKQRVLCLKVNAVLKVGDVSNN